MPKTNILIVDDEQSLRDSMKFMLGEKYKLFFADSGEKALQIIKKESIDLALLDIRLPKMDGIETLKQIKRIDESIDVIMITAVITVGTAVEAIKIGAYDYITKPFDIEAVGTLIEKVLEKRELVRENMRLKSVISKETKFEKIVGKSRAMHKIFELTAEVAKSNTTVLISGESGTGKELVARAIHNRSPRKNNLFVAVNCGAIPENLLESELFGHERGAFTGAMERHIGKFEIADKGTLFLDEIGSLPKNMQVKLLRVLQEKAIERVGGEKTIAVDVRIIAASNVDLRQEMKEGKFRDDLYFRLNVVPIHIPPLRERKEDISLLINHFVEKFNHQFGKKIKGFDVDALHALIEYAWPGNVRELENLIERTVVLFKGEGYITKNHLPLEIIGSFNASDTTESNDLAKLTNLPYKEAVQKFEAEFIRQAIEKAGGKKSKAAKMMGIHRNTLLQMRRKLSPTDNLE